MTAKGAISRARIVEQAAQVLNVKGYRTGRVREILSAVGLQKGGVYNHFKCKDDIAREAFKYAVDRMAARIDAVTAESCTGREAVEQVITVIVDLAANPCVPGGCPVMNVTAQSGQEEDGLVLDAQEALNRFIHKVSLLVARGQEDGSLHDDIRAADVATGIIATLEGGWMMSRLLRSTEPMEQAQKVARSYVAAVSVRGVHWTSVL